MSQREETVIMEYDVVWARKREDLVGFVNESIKAGWRLQGGVFACTYPLGAATDDGAIGNRWG